jgi:hypothetical protein
MSGTLRLPDRQIETSSYRYVGSLGAAEHGLIFYTSKEEMRNIHFAFVKSGLNGIRIIIGKLS